MELLHNFSTSTFSTLSSNMTVQKLWRTSVIKLGLSNEFVMRAILALSALHIASGEELEQRRDYWTSQAMVQHGHGMAVATVTLPLISEYNCAAHYIFGALTCIYAVAIQRDSNDIWISEEQGIPGWLNILRGVASIVDPFRSTLTSGPLGPIFTNGKEKFELRARLSARPSYQGDKLMGLRQHITDTMALDPRTQMALYAAIDDLANSFVYYDYPPEEYEPSDVFSWLYRVSEEYLSLLRENSQESLAILAYFCVVCRLLEDRWWVSGLSHHLMTRIYKTLDLEHRLWIIWPMEELGWLPGSGESL